MLESLGFITDFTNVIAEHFMCYSKTLQFRPSKPPGLSQELLFVMLLLNSYLPPAPLIQKS